MSKFRQVFLAIAIAIVFAFFIGFGIEAFYKSPKYENFCPDNGPINIETQQQCEDNGGRWADTQTDRLIVEKIAAPVSPSQYVCTKTGETTQNVTFNCQTIEQLEQTGYCDLYYYCNQEFQDASEKYNRNVFIIAVIFGVIALILGIILKIASVSSGLMGGGVLLIVYGIIRYWSGLQNYGRFIVLGIALAILIWIAYKKLKA
jgi:hypothetical protein